MRTSISPRPAQRAGFTIVELLAATVVFIGLMFMLVQATNSTADMWRRSSSKIEQFQQARRGFESMTRRISQATLNTYWDYHYPLRGGKPDRSQVPDGYLRQSELRFRTGQASTLLAGIGTVQRPTHAIFFQAPLGLVDDEVNVKQTDSNSPPVRSHKALNNLLNTWGYFIEVDTDANVVPDFLTTLLPANVRSRLIEMMEPSETLKMDNPSQVLNQDAQGRTTLLTMDPNWDNAAWLDWFRTPVGRTSPSNKRVLSENVLALIILPRLTPQDEEIRRKSSPPKTEVLCPSYDYDSKRLNNSNIGQPNRKATDPDLNPKNQLPPVVTVAMVAIDETSARRLAATHTGDPTFGLKWDQLFQESKKLENDPSTPEPNDGDLAALERQLRSMTPPLTYRIFTSNVAIRGAKWSRWQDN